MLGVELRPGNVGKWVQMRILDVLFRVLPFSSTALSDAGVKSYAPELRRPKADYKVGGCVHNPRVTWKVAQSGRGWDNGVSWGVTNPPSILGSDGKASRQEVQSFFSQEAALHSNRASDIPCSHIEGRNADVDPSIVLSCHVLQGAPPHSCLKSPSTSAQGIAE